MHHIHSEFFLWKLPNQYTFLQATSLYTTSAQALEKCSNFWGSEIICCLKIVLIMYAFYHCFLVKFTKIHGILLSNFEYKNRKTFHCWHLLLIRSVPTLNTLFFIRIKEQVTWKRKFNVKFLRDWQDFLDFFEFSLHTNFLKKSVFYW